jgi:tRNA threonylcarbamoyladenosine biosynthesis protein TsaB
VITNPLLNALAIDTSGSYCSVAVSDGQGKVFSLESQGDGDHFERLSSMVSGLLESSQVAASDLGQIRIGIGPGSFTGLRIGMSFAKGLAVALKIPLVGVSSFAAAGWVGLHDGGEPRLPGCLVIADARRDEVFLAEYSRDPDGAFSEVRQPAILPVSDVVSWKSSHPEGLVISMQRDFQIVGVEAVGLKPMPGVALGLLRLPIQIDNHGFLVSQVAELEPSYIRAVAAKSIHERQLLTGFQEINTLDTKLSSV